MFWNLEFLGFTDVHVLDGGWNQWQTLNATDSTTYPIDTTDFTSHTAATTPLKVDIQEHLVAANGYLEDVLLDFDHTKTVIFDTRPEYPSEFEVSGRKYKPGTERHGRVPHAKTLWWYDYCDTTTKMLKSPAAITALHDALGVTPDKEIITICTIGIRSTFNYFICRLLGFTNVKNALWGMKHIGNEGMAVSTDTVHGHSGQFPVERYGLWAPRRDLMAGAITITESYSPVTTHDAVVLAGGIDATGAPTAETYVFDVYHNSVSCAYNTTGSQHVLLADSSPTTIYCDNTTGFPSQGVLILEEEPIPYTGKTGTTFTGCDITGMQFDHKKKKGRVYMDPFNRYDATGAKVAYDAMPAAHHGGAAVSYNNCLYVFGGTVGGTAATTILKFDPTAAAGSQWTTPNSATLATARSHASAVVVPGTSDKVFILGGADAGGAALASVEVYDLTTETLDTTTTVTDLSTAKCRAAAAYEGGYVYTLGGLDSAGAVLDENERLDVTSLPGTWAALADLPTARSHLSASVVGGSIVVAGGLTNVTTVTPTDAAEEYDPSADTWKVLGGIYEKKYEHAQVTVGERFYLFGGAHHDPENPGTPLAVGCEHGMPASTTTGLTWDKAADMPVGAPRYAGAVVTSDVVTSSRLYVIGGLDSGGAASAKVYTYDTTNGWLDAGADLPAPRYGHAAAVDTTTGNIYVFGGMVGGSPSSTILRFDGSWSTLTGTLSVARYGLGAAYYNGDVYVLGGIDATGAAVTTHDCYAITGDTCTAATALPKARKWLTVVAADTSSTTTEWRILAMGGFDDSGTPLGEVRIYDPASPGWKYGDLMQTPRGAVASAVGSTGNVYAFGGWQTVLDFSQATAALEVYDPTYTAVKDYAAWAIRGDLKPGRFWAGVGALGGSVYVIGGFSGTYADDPAAVTGGIAYSTVIRHDE